MEGIDDKRYVIDDERVKALRRYQILDTPPEDAFDYVAQLATKIFGVPISLVSLVDKEQVFFKANVGLEGVKTTERGLSLCSYAVLTTDVTVFEDVDKEPCLLTDPVFVNNLGLRFYAGAPLITDDGHEIGTVCIIDRQPRTFSENERQLLAGLAKIVMHDLELRLAAIKTADEYHAAQRELNATNDILTGANEEVALINEKLAASNEELSASVEELNATNEDLNRFQEQLRVVNTQLEQRVQSRTAELKALNNEMRAAYQGLHDSQEELIFNNQKLLSSIRDLEASERNTKNIVENAPFPIGVYKGREMRIVLVNQSIMDVWGKGNDVTGKLYREVLPELDGVGPYEQLDEVFTTGRSFHARNQRIDLLINGKLKIHYFNYSFTALFDENNEVYGVMNTAADVTDVVLAKQTSEEMAEKLASSNDEIQAVNEELAATNEELRSTNEELQSVSENYQAVNNELFKSQNDLIFTLKAAGLGTFDLNPVTGKFSGNDLLKSWFGLKPEKEIELSDATDVIAEEDRPKVVAAIQKAMDYASGGDYDIDYTIINPQNPVNRVVRAKGKALFNDRHEPIRLSGTVQDITEQKRDELRKSDFIGMVSHELKTPLTSLTALIQVLHAKLRRSEDTFVSGALDKANVQVKKMSAMINGFLNISRLESGKILIEKQQFNLVSLLTDIIKETELTVSNHIINFNATEPIPVNADQDKIGSVITNLISNAVKYSPKDTTINVTCSAAGDKVTVSVKDQGIGIKPEDKDKLFDRYYRVKNAGTTHVSGFGIGLYLSSEIIERHHGKIGVESEFGEGSTFYFSLPLN